MNFILKAITVCVFAFVILAFIVQCSKGEASRNVTDKTLSLVDIQSVLGPPAIGYVSRFKDADTHIICYEYRNSISCVSP